MTSLESYFFRLRHGPPFVAGEEMQYEALRLASFATWPETAEKRPAQLASNGFYYCGHDDLVQCFSCGGKISNWSVRDDVQAEHKKQFPRCQFLQDRADGKSATGSCDVCEDGESTQIAEVADISTFGKCCNVSEDEESTNMDETVKVTEQMKSEPDKSNKRPATLIGVTEESAQLDEVGIMPEHMAMGSRACSSEGLVCQPNIMTSDRAECNHDIGYQHKTLEGSRQNSKKDEKPYKRSVSETFENMSNKPKFPAYAEKEARLESFKYWPKGNVIKPIELAEAGFYYVGYGDDVKCFSCGGAIRQWINSCDPWLLHAQRYHKCEFLRMKKGDDYIKEVTNNRPKTLAQRESAMTIFTVHNHVTNTAVLVNDISLEGNEQLLTPASNVERAISDPQQNKNTMRKSLAEKETAEIDGLRSEYQQLLKDRTCKICMNSTAKVVFLPCHHLVACDECAVALERGKCPICRCCIQTSIHVYF